MPTFSRDSETVPKGSWRWTLRVSESTALATIVLFVIVLHAADLSRNRYALGLALVAGQIGITVLIFRVLLPRSREDLRITGTALSLGALMTLGTFGFFRGEIPSVHLFFLPFIVISGLLGNVPAAAVAALIATSGYLGLSAAVGSAPGVLAGTLNSTLFLFSGVVAGVLSRELRDHYRRELVEQRRAISIGHRLTAVVDSVEEALVFTDQQGTVRLINRRAETLFDLDPSDHVGNPGVQLSRVIARLTEDPEGFMESLQVVRDEPLQELSLRIEQIIPARRILQMLSRSVVDDSGSRVGRIDVFTDVTEAERRASEAERLYRQARDTAESYQRALLPTQTPSVPRLTIVAHYIPAAGQRAVCGDFYDFLSLKEGGVAAVLGDVCGVGPTAVNDAALTRYTISSQTRSQRDPGKLLELTNLHVAERLGIDRFVRVFIGVLDPERAVLEYANAGHVPPVLFRASSGEVEWLEEGGLPLGVEPGADFKTTRIDLEPGDTVFLYTDGVNEASRRGEPFGQGKLSDLVKHFGYGTPGELVQGVRRAVEGWVEGELRDDLAMVGVEVVPDVAVAEPTRELVLPNEQSRIREVRSFVAEFLADLRAPVDAASDVVLAASEAASNAMKYGYRTDIHGELRVQCVLAGVDVIVTIADEGPGFERALGELGDGEGVPDPLAVGGRGMFLMKELSDDLQIDSSHHGSTVVLRRRVFHEPPVPST
jgi:serine phosphatase RsbU (regulator of sigma subunit)/anti-sigma regulatory factor (Ser/Thr protein kinase)/PAS domain-containing protein